MALRVALLGLACALVAAACAPTQGTPAPRSGPAGGPLLAPRDRWAQDRVEAVLALYTFTPQAAEAIRGLDVRHVLGRPGWFGSTGYRGFTGIGQARPSSIVHEISHALYGPFPVVGRPELSYDPRPGEPLSSGLAAQRRDLETFVQQPPDAFEPLRARLRLIPDLITGAYPGLYHLGEAEVIFFTGGALNLVPPILRKYYAPLLEPGGFASWDEATGWYLRLPGEQRRIADAYLGIGHVPLGGYRVEPDPKARVEPRIAAVVLREERQRLTDFVQQFDLYFKPLDRGGAVVEDVRFWRGYLRDMVRVYRLHSGAARGAGSQGRRIGEAFQFLVDVERLPRERRPAFARERLTGERFLMSFAPALDNATLLALTRGDGPLADEMRGALEPLHVQLLDLAADLQRLAPSGLAPAGLAFDRFLRGLSERQRESMNFVIETLAEVDRDLTRAVMTRLSPEMARVLVTKGPAFTRFLLEPEEVVAALGYEGPLTPERLEELARLFNEHVSATPSIDDPFLKSVYQRIAGLGQRDSQRAMHVFIHTGLLVEPFLTEMPKEAANLFDRDLALAAEVFERANPVRLPPARAIYRLVQTDPALAARVTLVYDDQKKLDVVSDALAFFAYDLPRSKGQQGLGISLEHNARYLEALARLRGDAWLEDALSRMARRYQERIAEGELDPGFPRVYRETVEASVAGIPDPLARGRLERIVARGLAGV